MADESQNTTVPHGALGYIGHNECVHAYIGFAEEELKRMGEFRKVQAEVE